MLYVIFLCALDLINIILSYVHVYNYMHRELTFIDVTLLMCILNLDPFHSMIIYVYWYMVINFDEHQ